MSVLNLKIMLLKNIKEVLGLNFNYEILRLSSVNKKKFLKTYIVNVMDHMN